MGNKITKYLLLLSFLFIPFTVFASNTDGTINSTNKYAWSEGVGWINFGAVEGNVHITGSVLTGYAWGENVGWISLNCSNDSSCLSVDYKVSNNGNGTLSGYAWGENTGWINFNPTYGGVTINSSGEFLGYAWGENTGWIVFNCATTNSCGTVNYKTQTDWIPQSARPQCNNTLDDDGDGKIDYPTDDGCSSLNDDDETVTVTAVIPSVVVAPAPVEESAPVAEPEPIEPELTPEPTPIPTEIVPEPGIVPEPVPLSPEVAPINAEIIRIEDLIQQLQEELNKITTTELELIPVPASEVESGLVPGVETAPAPESAPASEAGLGAEPGTSPGSGIKPGSMPGPGTEPSVQPVAKWCESEGKNINTNDWAKEKCELPLALVVEKRVKEVVNVAQEVTVKAVKETKKFVESPSGSKVTKTVSTVGLVVGGAAASSVVVLAPSIFPSIFSSFLRLFGIGMAALGLKKKIVPWGTAYDSVTKQPLDPAYVVLENLEGKEIASSITDLDGRYGFLTEPGKYRMIAQKTHYKFPSQKLVGRTSDELYDNLYFGGEIEISNTGDVIMKNIPLDPEQFDWNEFAKKKKNLFKFYSQLDPFIRWFSDVLFVLGFFVAIVAIVFVPRPYNLVIFILYVILLILRLMGLKPKAHGFVRERTTGYPLSFAIVHVFQADLRKELFHRITDKYGRYYILISKGKYYLEIEKKNDDGSYSHVFTSRVINAQKGIIKEKFVI